jgi:bla regulator protein blaR1
MILMPIGLLAGLPPGQIEPILLHELAHIRRCD